MSLSRVWEMSRLQRSIKVRPAASGFTLIEVLVSIAVLSIGLMGVAMLIGTTLATGTKAKFMNIANVLASEKLDDLNKLSSNDPNLVPGGSLAGGSTCAAGDIYCDQVTVNAATGADYETETETVNNAPVTTTIVHTNAGCVGTPAACNVANPAAGGSTFTRRWLVTLSPTVSSSAGAATITNARRVTVLVTLNDQTASNPVSFQMSMVRP
jgi:prepilin-type N-terminal cleavage/methylation domain-containing protein